MNLAEYKNLDPQKIGSWPLPARIGVVTVLCVAMLYGGYHFFTSEKIVQLENVEQEEKRLMDTFVAKQKKAANLIPLRAQLAEMKRSFGDMLRLLPNKTEIEALLVDISQSGLAAGLEFELFQPGKEVPADFYATQPITIRVTGAYHEFGEFISAVAALPRIVTQHNVKIGAAEGKGADRLTMNMVAKTYRYLEEEE